MRMYLMGLLQGCKEDIDENLVLMRGCIKEEYGSKLMWLLAALTSLQAGRMAESLSLLLAFSRRLLFQITCFKRKDEKSISLSILLKQLERCFWLGKKKERFRGGRGWSKRTLGSRLEHGLQAMLSQRRNKGWVNKQITKKWARHSGTHLWFVEL